MSGIRRQMQNGNFYLTVAFIIMVILFISSSQTYEQQSQIGLLSRLLRGEPFKERLGEISFMYGGSEVSIAHSGYFKFVEFFIRKGAHFGTYFVIGWGFFLGISKKMKILWLPALLAWLSATGYAALDEFHQMLTGGRTPLFQDVILDSAGAATGIVLTIAFGLIFAKKSRKRL